MNACVTPSMKAVDFIHTRKSTNFAYKAEVQRMLRDFDHIAT